jgi:hypothetical protein
MEMDSVAQRFKGPREKGCFFQKINMTQLEFHVLIFKPYRIIRKVQK